jgi:hypothetical protein
MVGDLLRDFEFTALLQMRRIAGRAGRYDGQPRFAAGAVARRAGDVVSVLVGEGIGMNWAGLRTTRKR